MKEKREIRDERKKDNGVKEEGEKSKGRRKDEKE